MAAQQPGRPITVALVDDYDVVLIGVAHLFDAYRDRVVVAEIDANNALRDDVDIVLYDAYAQTESDHNEVAELVRNPRARRVVVASGSCEPDLVAASLRQGVHGYLSKTRSAEQLVDALEAVHAARTV